MTIKDPLKDLRVLLAAVVFMLFSLAPVRAAWDETGNPVCQNTGHQWYPTSISDGHGGALVIWQDYSDISGNILLQRLDEGGLPLLGTGGVPVCTDPSAREFFRQAVPDGAGGAVVAWTDHRSGNIDIYVQRIDGEGSPLWPAAGMSVSSAGVDDCYPVIISGSGGDLLLAWQQGNDTDSRIIVQKIGLDGVVAWTAGGIAVSAGTGQYMPAAISDGNGGIIVSWTTGVPGSGVIMAQHIGPDGTLLWGNSGKVVCDQGDASGFPSLCGDGSGGVLVVWEDMRSGDRDLYSQHIDSGGSILWSAEGTLFATGTGEQWFTQTISDGSGGLIAVWVDDSGTDHDLRAQRIDPSGNMMWTPVGIVICGETGSQLNPRIADSGEGTYIVVWQDDRTGDYDIYAQKIDLAGANAWDTGGTPVVSESGDQRLPELFGDSMGGAVVTWEHWDGESDIYSQHIGTDGQYLATELAGFATKVSSGGIEINWEMSESEEGMIFIVSRSETGDGYFSELDGPVENPGLSSFHYLDTTVESGQDYIYRVAVTGSEGTKLLFETGVLKATVRATVIRQNYPNPFNPVTTISYDLAERAFVELSVFDVSGRRISMLVKGIEGPGEHDVVWNGCDDRGGPVSSGVYFYRLRAGKDVLTRKMILLR